MIFIFGTSIEFTDKIPPFRPEGLDPEARYSVTCYGDEWNSGWSRERGDIKYTSVSGRTAMANGLRVDLVGDYDCRILHLKRDRS